MVEKLKEQIEQVQKIIDQDKQWQATYGRYAEVMLNNEGLLMDFYRRCKKYEQVQFYLTEVINNLPDLFAISVRYMGQDIAKVVINKENQVKITTEDYDESNKKDFGCDIQLKDEDWESKETQAFLDYFKSDIIRKTKSNEKVRDENMLLAEFDIRTASQKLMTGIRPVKFGNLFYPLPIPSKEGIEYINILTRSKIRKLTIVEVMAEGEDQEAVLARATRKAVFLNNLLRSEHGDSWYKIMGYHGRKPHILSIKVCIATNKKLSVKCKEFESFEIRHNVADILDYRYLQYENDQEKITSIKSNVNE